MTKFPKLRALAAAAGACVALAAASSANAEVYSLSQQTIRDFSIGIFDGLNPAITTVDSFKYTLTNKATVNGTTVNTTATCNQDTCVDAIPVLNAAAANVGGVTKGENDFTAQGQAPAGATYSRADSVIAEDQLTSGGLSLTRESQIAESLLNIGGNADSNSTLLSTSSLSLTFTVSGSDDNVLVLGFSADLIQALGIANPTGNPLVSSAVNTNFTLTDTGFDQVNWTPNGAAGGCIVDAGFGGGSVTCSDELDPFNLNRTVSSSTIPTSFNQSKTGLFGITLTGLGNGTYTFDLSTKVETQIQQDVPEPGSLALAGLALAGLGFATRRKQKKA